MRREPRALRPQRLLRHLDDDLLPFLEELFDLRLGFVLVAVAIATAAIPARRARDLSRYPRRRRRVVVGLEPVELLEGGDDVAHIEEAVALESEVNKRRLHAGEDFRHPAF